MMKVRLKLRGQRGLILPVIIIIGAIFFTMIVAITLYSSAIYNSARRNLIGLDALAVAEAGADSFLYNINLNNSYTGTNITCPITSSGASPVTLFNDSTQGKGTYETCSAAGSIANEKIVYSVGKIYFPQTATTPILTRTVKLVIEGTQAQGYAVVSGAGGLAMSNNAIIGGLVYIDGKISLSNNATIGSVTQPATVNVAYYNCPSPADNTYPALCASGQPISIINTAHIYGNVTANNQTSTTGMSNNGLVGSSGVSYMAMPDYDRAAQKAAVTNTMDAASASCSSGSKTWPANTHITGGSVSLNNSCVVTVMGNIWIDGDFTIKNQAAIKVSDSLGAAPVIMIDGSGGANFINNAVIASNQAGWGFKFITFYSKASCSPDCTNVTGANLANSQGIKTMTMGNSGLGANTLFYARWTKVFVNNNGAVGGINGQTIELQNNGNITFGYSVGGSAITWDVRYYERL